MEIMENRTLGGGVYMYCTPSLPGWRCYVQDSTSGTFEISKHETAGALVLWNPEGYDTEPFDVLTVLEERRRTLPRGPMAEHTRRAEMIARAFSDGAYTATERLARVFHLESGERGSLWALNRAHDVAQPSFHELREYLSEDEGVPYIVAVLVAIRFSRNGLRLFHTSGPAPF